MMERYQYEVFEDCYYPTLYVVKDCAVKKMMLQLSSENECVEVCHLLNSLDKELNVYQNEMGRLENELVNLDIMIGELSWLLDKRCFEYLDSERLDELSRRLSETITRAMYPKERKLVFE